MTKPKLFNCPSCGGSNRTCGHCLTTLQTPRIRQQQSRIQACGWASKVKQNRDAGRILGSAELSVLKLQERGVCPVPFGKAGQEWSVESRFAPTFPRFGLGGPGHSEENEEALRASSEK
uniref:Uncharacterized protein n=1 Tax=Nothobranchius kadleci TaxID=1051664 RepID=A0A1A8EFI8_NOTKA